MLKTRPKMIVTSCDAKRVGDIEKTASLTTINRAPPAKTGWWWLVHDDDATSGTWDSWLPSRWHSEPRSADRVGLVRTTMLTWVHGIGWFLVTSPLARSFIGVIMGPWDMSRRKRADSRNLSSRHVTGVSARNARILAITSGGLAYLWWLFDFIIKTLEQKKWVAIPRRISPFLLLF